MAKTKGISYIQRTLRTLREMGRINAIVEKFNFYAGIRGKREDLFGIIDILSLDPVAGVVGVQVCGKDWAEHIHKITVTRAQETYDWLNINVGCEECGKKVRVTQLELWGWRKLKRGNQYRWIPRVAHFRIEDEKIKYKIIK